MKIHLRSDFAFMHQPLAGIAEDSREGEGPHAAMKKSLLVRILHSFGGSFLITGYRGVGKTTFVNHLLKDISKSNQSGDTRNIQTVVDIRMNVSRSLTAEELMHQLIRGLYERLHQLGVWDSIGIDLQKRLELCVLRTSSTVLLKEQETKELLFGRTLEGQVPWVNIKPGVRSDRKSVSSHNRDISYLAYTAQLAEYDLIQVARGLLKMSKVGRTEKSRRPFFLRWKTRSAVISKIIFVFDEMDKIESSPIDIIHPVEPILSSLKTLFTESGITFIFVAGRDLYDRWVADMRRGDSILESIFTDALYIPTLWGRTGDICDQFLPDHFRTEAPGDEQRAYEDFRDFLSFRGRGIARKLLRGFNEYVRFVDGKFFLEFSHGDLRQFRFYANLHRYLAFNEMKVLTEAVEYKERYVVDNLRLGIYYIVDWMIMQHDSKFSLDDTLAASFALSKLISFSAELAPIFIKTIIDLLLSKEYIEIHQSASVLPIDGDAVVYYRVPRRRIIEMGVLSPIFRSDRPAPVKMPDEGKNRFDERYEVLDTIGKGGFATVYRALDRRTGQIVAIKAARSERPEFDEALAKEARILALLMDEKIVKVNAFHERAEGSYMVMPFIEGVTLHHLIDRRKLIDHQEFFLIAFLICSAVQHAHEKGVLWLDAKPENILFSRNGKITLIDFGTSVMIGEKHSNVTAFTPAFSAPEIKKQENFSKEADIFSLGVLFYLMSFGNYPPKDENDNLIENPTMFGASQEIFMFHESVTRGCLRMRGAKRFRSITEMMDAFPSSRRQVDLKKLYKKIEDSGQGKISYEIEMTRPLSASTAPRVPRRTFIPPDPEADPFASFAIRTGAPPDFSPPAERGGADVAIMQKPETMPSIKPMVAIEITDDAAQRRQELFGYNITIGRSGENTLRIDDIAASRFQCALTWEGDHYRLEGRNSANGTTLNGALLMEPVAIGAGDTIGIGRTRITVLTVRSPE